MQIYPWLQGIATPGDIRPKLQFGHLDIFLCLLYFYPCSFLLAFFFCYFVLFNLTVPMHKCLGEHLCMSSPFSTSILNGTYSFSAATVKYSASGALLNLTCTI